MAKSKKSFAWITIAVLIAIALLAILNDLAKIVQKRVKRQSFTNKRRNHCKASVPNPVNIYSEVRRLNREILIKLHKERY